uniref:Uncharacterized protein n=1 Tax=Rhizophora mucronata TaxID=61149 RepID=A0A2P2LR93_RHIMU
MTDYLVHNKKGQLLGSQ